MLAWAALAGADEPRDAMLDVALCDASHLPKALTDEIAAESMAVWDEAGVVLRVTAIDAACDAVPMSPLVVRVDDSPQRGGGPPRRTVGSIAFRAGRPTPLVTLSLQAARFLIAKDPATRPMLGHVTQRVADCWTGRMLGRALAHEIGHYLLRSPEHAPTGLMRATHTVQAFVALDRSAFSVTPAQRLLVLAGRAMPSIADMASAKN